MTVIVKGITGSPVLFAEGQLLVVGFGGMEGMSQLFNLEVQIQSPADIPFDKLLGQQLLVRVRQIANKPRFFHGICINVSQATRIDGSVIFRAVIAPKFWFLTRRIRSRVFHQVTVKQILSQVLTEGGLAENVDFKQNITGNHPKHDFCVQYRESDFEFLSRLMEEEGIFYFFTHTAQGHQMVISDSNAESVLPAVADKQTFGRDRTAGSPGPNRVFDWEKGQQLRSTLYTARDHHFAQNNPRVEKSQSATASVPVGTVTHKLDHTGLGKPLEIFEYPNDYAHRFDQSKPGGSDDPSGLQGLQGDMGRIAEVRVQQEMIQSLLITGSGSCEFFAAGARFVMTGHFNGNGQYILVGVSHAASQAADGTFSYQNNFSCIPLSPSYAFRPPRVTPRPFIPGTQTATVVGIDPKSAPDQEIFTDKFGRVKVQFHWDRDNTPGADCSCWCRVGQVVAGKRWGASFWPRVGQEVIVAFLEGNPDQPIIVGSVYNAVQMPPYLGAGGDSKHADDNKISGIKSNSTLGGVGFNEWRFDDNKGKEQIFFHAERNMDTRVKNDSNELVLHDRNLIVGFEKDGTKSGDQKEKVFKDKHLHVLGNQEEHIGGNFKLMVGHGDVDGGVVQIVIEKNKFELIEKSSELHVKEDVGILMDKQVSQTVGEDFFESVGGDANHTYKKNLNEKITATHSLNSADFQHKVGKNHAVDAGTEIHLKAGQKIIIEAGTQISLKVGGNFIDISSAGISIVGSMVNINSGGSAGSGSGCSPTDPVAPTAPNDPEQAAPVDPVIADDSKSGQKSAPG